MTCSEKFLHRIWKCKNSIVRAFSFQPGSGEGPGRDLLRLWQFREISLRALVADNAASVTTGRQLPGKNMKQWARQKQHQHQPAQTGFDWQCLFQIKFMLINHWIIFAATIRRQFFTWKLWIAAGTELTKLNYVVCVTPQEDLNTKYICWEYFKVFIHKIRKRRHWSRIKSILY